MRREAETSHPAPLEKVDPELRRYVEEKILPCYDRYDAAHSRKHILMVIRQSMELCYRLEGLDPDMVYAVAAYHDLGICEGRELHHLSSGRMMAEDPELRRWFSEEQIRVMREAVEDHRASSGHEPRSLYGKVVAEADRTIDPDEIFARAILYGAEHCPDYTPSQLYERCAAHLKEKYGDGGYLHLQFGDSPNAARLEELRKILRDPEELKREYGRFEIHPWKPFAPEKAQILFLGSFPPPRARWSMEFYYPNFINDMWRIMGLLFFGDRDHFVQKVKKGFDLESIVSFCNEKGLAFYDAGYLVKREKGNASDKFLKIIVPSDIPGLLSQLPDCRRIVSAGERSAGVIAELLGCGAPAVGDSVAAELDLTAREGGYRQMKFWRMPSSSRAYPMSLEKKAAVYAVLFRDAGLL